MADYHHFGLGHGHITRAEYERCSRIARSHGAEFYSGVIPGQGATYWFATRDIGAPFVVAIAMAVLADVGTVETYDPRRRKSGPHGP